jgi:tRNA pseudouridine38-40 synthase
MDASRVAFALNTYLPADIRIQGSEEVPPGFHPRFQETIKTYEYKILNRTFPDPSKRLYTMFWHYPLDVNQMHRAAQCLVGTHDFTSFCTLQPHVQDRTRTIYRADVTRDDEDVITIRITGNGFLYNMVRIIAGTLIRVGGGQIPPGDMSRILEAKDRQAAAETARPEGLTLVSIEYPAYNAGR